MTKIRYFTSFDDEMVTLKPAQGSADRMASITGQSSDRSRRLIAAGARWFGQLVIQPWRQYHFIGAEKLRQCTGGCFLFVNHTQPVGDAFMPFVLGQSRPVYVVAAAANLAVPVLGRLIPRGGGLILPSHPRGLHAFGQTVAQAIADGAIVTLYPEAHVWPFATQIRPFVTGAFHYPVAAKAPVFVQTNTYQPGFWGRPRITAYLDGPFWPDPSWSRQVQRQQLAQQVHATMCWRAQANTVEPIQYRRREKAQ
ncbi:1-acyl-sn-glycerol-3-phosphate acyltransferase [Lacticaseibacillus daqingensis]|uniref:1-acyl-sn-glycerol-3-phosphate acyltransferase n=1 Tax=Lacticaseibacillus daqingensis TaxID=2486014 RepID=UPI000F7B29EE|nr:1-acyl-sn-glycerol-3-phosphate acyltransferase [Lacticaseibacillus daqingensis]